MYHESLLGRLFHASTVRIAKQVTTAHRLFYYSCPRPVTQVNSQPTVTTFHHRSQGISVNSFAGASIPATNKADLIFEVSPASVELLPRAWLARWWGRWLTTTLHHDLHHAQGRHNYGLYFTWWDCIGGTEHPEYRVRLQQFVQSLDRSITGAPIAANRSFDL